MNIFLRVVTKSTPEELAGLIADMAKEKESYRTAFYAAKAFIDTSFGAKDTTPEMSKAYDLYHVALRNVEY